MTLLLALALLNPDPLIDIQKGELPIIISAPHGGRLPITDCPLRTNTKAPQFVTVLDTNSDKLAQATAKELQKLTGKKPWLIIAKFSRKYVDANRPEADGTESGSGKAVYQRYHAALREAVEANKSNPKALLIDFHSQGKTKDLIYRGTGNSLSLKSKSLADVSAFLNGLEQATLKLEPATANTIAKEHPSFNGGYITRHYGASQPNGINAIQLEIGADYRNKESIPKTAIAIAEAIQAHLESPK